MVKITSQKISGLWGNKPDNKDPKKKVQTAIQMLSECVGQFRQYRGTDEQLQKIVGDLKMLIDSANDFSFLSDTPNPGTRF